MGRQIDPNECLRLEEVPLTDAAAAIDCIDETVFAATETFTRAGLGDVFSMLQTPAALSIGQQHRYRLAMALAHSARYIFADEFTSSLDRITAAVTAHQIRKRAAQYGKVFILASSHEDILPDLRPDILIVKNLSGNTETLYRDPARDPAGGFRITRKWHAGT